MTQEITKYEKLCIVRSLLKELKKLDADLYAECKYDFQDAAEASGLDRISIKLNGVKIGQMSLMDKTPGIVVVEPEEFSTWAYLAGFQKRRTVIDADALPVEVIEELASKYPGAVKTEVETYDEWKLHVSVKDGAVIDDNGEVVPGVDTFEPLKTVVLTGCKFDDVRKAVSREHILDVLAAPLLGGDVIEL